jgi:hypothetical protein
MTTKEKLNPNPLKICRNFPVIIFLVSFLLIACQQNHMTAEETGESVFESLDNEIIIDLNSLTYTIANEHDQFLSFIGVRALAMTHLAIHDALNAIEPQYEPYAFTGKYEEADPIAAAAQAARVVLENAYPSRKDTIYAVCNQWLASVEDGEAKDKGIALGNLSAEKIIEIREGDGHEKNGEYTPMTKPGDYQYTPGFDWVWKPDFSYTRPFTLDSLAQFRSPTPPALTSDVYAADYNEVKAYGCKGSKVRSEDETHYAHWWAEFAEHGWNRIGRITAEDKNLPIRETVRMFALINMNLYDMYLVSFDSKYHYDTWRPITAIQQGDTDDNPKTEPDADWEPEMLTPPWPDYPSAHAAVAAGGAEIVIHVYGSPEVSFTMESVTALPTAKSRTYHHLDSVANDCANSRIMNGFHFRFATEEGKVQGRKVAKHVIGNYLRPLNEVE